MSEERNTIYLQLSTFARPVLVIGVLFCLSVYFNRSQWEHLSAWEYAAFAVLPLILVAAFLARTRTFIRFDDDSLTVHYVTGSERRFALRDITQVGIATLKRPMPTVVLRLRDDVPGLTAQNKVYRTMTGYDVSIPPFFGPAKALAARIEEARLRKGAPVN